MTQCNIIETFEIKLQEPKSVQLPANLKDRLFVSKKTVTQEDIDQKLRQAATKRHELKQVRLPAQDRIALTQTRRESLENAELLKVK
jgi:hypothetical protein